jgi:tripartite-type tricarboxylate transporter receptor subunit TctC
VNRRESLARLAALAVAGSGAALSSSAQAADDYPSRDIRVMVGYPPGSASENSLRALARVAQKYLKAPLVVFNRPGANQAIALAAIADSPADGYTIAMTTDSFISVTRHQQKLRFDVGVLLPVLAYAELQQVLFVRSDYPHPLYDDFVAQGGKPGVYVTIGGTGQGTAPDLIARTLLEKTKIQGIYVPFKGSNEYVAAVTGGQLTAGLVDYSGIKNQVDAKAMKLVLVIGDRRLPDHPDVPSSREVGLGDLDLFNPLRCIVIHRATPPERLRVLQDAFTKAVADPEFKSWAATNGLEALDVSTREIEERIRKTEDFGIPLLKRMNMYVD